MLWHLNDIGMGVKEDILCWLEGLGEQAEGVASCESRKLSGHLWVGWGCFDSTA